MSLTVIAYKKLLGGLQLAFLWYSNLDFFCNQLIELLLIRVMLCNMDPPPISRITRQEIPIHYRNPITVLVEVCTYRIG